ncbi:MAG: thiamine pyrophosphate-binding protein [Thermomicrobiales bacterium]|nr:thiamine pyrophosphate-binding protein [Thermomicrobiales bacterium]
MNGADLLVACLKDRGVEFVTTLSGNGMDPFYEACRRADLPLIDFRNEQAAAFAADAVARLDKKLAVCAVNATVGHANALVGLVNANFAGSPVLLISGAAPHAQADLGRFQDFDQVAMSAPICKYAKTIDQADRIPFYVHEACSRAVSGRPGPVNLSIPADILNAEVTWNGEWGSTPASAAVNPVALPSADRIAAAADLIGAAERPVIVAGSGIYFSGGEAALAELASAYDIPVVVPIWDQGTIAKGNEQFVGFIGAAYGGPKLLPDADVLIMLGARVDYRVGFGQAPGLAPDVKIVRVDIDPNELVQGREPDVAIQADPKSAIEAITAALGSAKASRKSAWMTEAKRRWNSFRSPWTGEAPPATPLTGQHIVRAIQPLLGDDLLFLIDGGNIGQWSHMAIGDHYSANWMTCGPSGVVGWGISGAVSAKLAHPEKSVLLLSGDGAVGFCLMELETAVRHNTPIVVIIADDREWGSVVTGQQRVYGQEGVVASLLGPVAYDTVAEGLGAAGVRVTEAADLQPAIEKALKSGVTTLIHVPITGGSPKGGDPI